VHGQTHLDKALETTNKLFGNNVPANELSEEDLLNIEGIVKLKFRRDALASGADLLSFLTETSIFASKGEARKMIQNSGLSINGNKVSDEKTVDAGKLLHGKFLLIQKGKKNFYLVTAE
jgi:tyrosyl-tRNA synthetase